MLCMINFKCLRNLVSSTCKKGRIHSILNVQYICNLKTRCIQYFCVDLVFTVDIKKSWNCVEISYLMLVSKVVSKYNAIVAIVAVFLKANYSDDQTLLRFFCISEFWSILQESCNRIHLESILLSCVKHPFAIGYYSLFASLCFLVLGFFLIIPKLKLHFTTCSLSYGFFSPYNCISSIFIVLFQFKLFSQVPGDFRGS